ncbi:cyclase family protein [Rathayibacter sp. VKM Ac-2835]|uniref:cyclase family protein n=1 Tax=Rathayibacter sp. VKM Ac-2835 TaxID=2739043 RepID=UPI001565C50D|nr:cyclase family protein [Rathayibacter sp. VKM Ac-2835]NRG41055.1 cyclase family protein [Rathayibacter sp. VKM Ac-2835]
MTVQTPERSVTGPDPMAPWLREIEAAHAASRHRDGVRCRGSVDLIDEAARLRGAREVRLGRAVSLEREIETRPDRLALLAEVLREEKEQWQALAVAELPDGHGSVDLTVSVGIHGRGTHGGDVISYDAHGIHNTHMDGFAHIGADGEWHGGIPASASQTEEDTMVAWSQHGIATRGVLLDIPAVRGSEWVTAEDPVTSDDLDAALERTGVTLEPGDALLIYQGRDRFEEAGNRYTPGAVLRPRPGIEESGARWIAAHDPGVVSWDFHDARRNQRNALEVHGLIWAIGLCLIDNSLLGPAARALAAAGRHTGQLIAAPTAIHRSTGVIINPLLLF